jgi:hypothetical protein
LETTAQVTKTELRAYGKKRKPHLGKPAMNNKQPTVKFLGLAAMLFLTGLSLKMTAQTPEEFRERYGNPQSGVYTIRTGIGARISFNDASQASEIDVAPLRSEAPGSAISATEAAKILDELMPMGVEANWLREASFQHRARWAISKNTKMPQ